VFLTIDRLSWAGQIIIWPPKNGDYLVSVTPSSGVTVLKSKVVA
jgi:hypothetical protein